MTEPEDSSSTQALSRGEHWLGTTVIVAASLAMLWPAFGPLEADSFPLSTFPMFARHRGQPRMHQLLGITKDGARRHLEPKHLGTSEVLQAKALIDRAARSSQRRRALCRQVAARVSSDADYDDVVRLELRSVRFDPVKYFTSGPEPVEQKRLATCRLEHSPSNGAEPREKQEPQPEAP